MFEFIKGSLIEKTPNKAVVETGGIGYRIAIALNTYTRLRATGQNAQFFLSQVVREDSNTLYGFIEKEERDLFETLIAISGIGPKTALAIIGHVEMASFHRAIATSDIRLLSKIPGIGKKTAERLVIEMRDKLKGKPISHSDGLSGDAINALLNLGYNPIEAQKAVREALNEEKEDLGKIITLALKKVGSMVS